VAHDIADVVLSHLSNFAVGFVRRKEGAGSEVFGSGTLVSIEGRRGILTCGHVANVYKKLPEIGLVRFSGVGMQKHMLQLGDTETIIVCSSDTWTETDLDLAFTFLPPDIADSVGARGIFLNIEKNRTKIEGGAPSDGKHVDAMLGLVAEFSGKPFIEGGQFISPMRAILHTGHISSPKKESTMLTFAPMDYNRHELPKSFGGMSGAGLWRVYFIEDEKQIVQAKLVGVTSWQITDDPDQKLACQGWARIDQGLIPTVRQKLAF